jgi:hypothetical protein
MAQDDPSTRAKPDHCDVNIIANAAGDRIAVDDPSTGTPDDVVKRLRSVASLPGFGHFNRLSTEAADTIARVMRERDEYRDDYLRRHKDAMDRLERAIIAEARCKEQTALYNKMADRIRELEAERDRLQDGAFQLARQIDALHAELAVEMSAQKKASPV